MEVLASYCGRGAGAAFTLAAVNVQTFSTRSIELFPNRPPEDVCGLVAGAQFVYLAVRRPAAIIVLERRGLRPVHRHALPDFNDLHSLALRGRELFVVSTGTDEVVCLSLQPPRIVSQCVLWRPLGSVERSDANHLNGLCFFRDELHVSGFGKRSGNQWATAAEGFILNLDRSVTVATGIHHPHSLLPLDDGIAYCESGRMTVHLPAHPPVHGLPGYTRGLCRSGEHLLVASSTRRRTSRTTGKPVAAPREGHPTDRCAITRVSLRTGAVEGSVDLSRYGGEIYDLLPLADE
jgi:hypothetical protein